MTTFTAHTWIEENVKESFAILFDNLNHTRGSVHFHVIPVQQSNIEIQIHKGYKHVQ